MKTPASPLLAALLIVLIHTACKKSLPAAVGNTLTKTATSTAGNAQSMQIDTFIYNNQNQLAVVITGIIGSSGGDTVSFQYDASGRLTSFIPGSWPLGYPLFRYDMGYNSSGQLVTATAVPLVPGYSTESYSYGYNAAGQLTSDSVLEQPLLASPALAVTVYDTYTYDENGNLIVDSSYRSTNASPFGPPFAAQSGAHYTYDTHVNPYYNMGIPLAAPVLENFQILSKNNVVSVLSTTPLSMTTSFSYSYYSNGRPRTQALFSAGVNGNPPLNYTTEYFYQ